ncbi:hypothetical protein V1264_001769 [Littorina saxatilis]|uniref:Uncharacterized protein n=1 Tax=Littorina saxatilis TaxID=31220 RepID=A0AAN9GPH3_9CAEN
MQSKDSSTPISDESVHMQLLQRALKKTTGKCVSSFKFSLFRRQLEPIYKKAPKTLEKLHEGAVSELASNIEEELSVMFEEENIEEFMAKLDEMKAQADEITEDITAWLVTKDKFQK